MNLLAGKRAVVMGLATQQSLAYGIGLAFHRQGARLLLTHQNERLGREAAKLSESLPGALHLPCDVRDDDQIEATFTRVAEEWGGVDVVVHAIAHAPREALQGDFLEGLSREAFRSAHDVSAYSFSAVARASRGLMEPGGSLLTLSYAGATRSVAHYNVMGAAKASLEASVRYLAAALGPEGLRVNAISAGPIRTLAARGIAGLPRLLDHAARAAPLRRNVTIDDVGKAAVFLASDLASGVTGEVLYVDGGLSTVALPPDTA